MQNNSFFGNTSTWLAIFSWIIRPATDIFPKIRIIVVSCLYITSGCFQKGGRVFFPISWLSASGVHRRRDVNAYAPPPSLSPSNTCKIGNNCGLTSTKAYIYKLTTAPPLEQVISAPLLSPDQSVRVVRALHKDFFVSLFSLANNFPYHQYWKIN